MNIIPVDSTPLRYSYTDKLPYEFKQAIIDNNIKTLFCLCDESSRKITLKGYIL